MREYHDTEWGVPSHDDQYLFEMLTLEGAQAGLSWSTVLNKRDGYRKAFADFDVEKVARFTPARADKLMLDSRIIRNRLKISSTISNAQAFIAVQKDFGSFADYLWGFVNNKTVKHDGKSFPVSDELSDRVSKDLKKRGFRFVGTTIIYSYLQAVGVINDHGLRCPAR